MGPRRQALRAATSALHKELDGLMGRLTDLSVYTHYLLSTTAFRASVECELAHGVSAVAGYVPMFLHGELVLDCADLGFAPTMGMRDVAIGRSPSHQLGLMYVLEGSSLGAHLLLSDARELGLTADYGARHLFKQIGFPERWNEFLRRLEEAEDFNLDDAVASATRVFQVAISFAESRHRVS